MKNSPNYKNGLLLVIFASAVILRLYKLGTVPKGLGPSEVKLGLFLQNWFGDWALSGFFVRLPFALLGTASVILLFFVVKKLIQDFWLSVFSSFFLAIAPWHVQESRIFSFSILYFIALEVFLYLFGAKLKTRIRKISYLFLVFSFIFFLFAPFGMDINLSTKVNTIRSFTDFSLTPFISRIFVNKYFLGYKEEITQIYQSFDFGYYFFASHPRERWGMEEAQKIFITFLPLTFLGFAKLRRKLKILIVSSFFFVGSLYSFFDIFDSGSYFPLVLVFSLLSAKGIIYLKKQNKLFLSFLFLFLIFEMAVFVNNYFKGYSESLFSPRKDYEEVVIETSKIKGEKVLVSPNIKSSKDYFSFYLKKNTKNYEFREFDFENEENKSKIFVDIVEINSLAEENYKKQTKVLYEKTYSKTNQKIIIFTQK